MNTCDFIGQTPEEVHNAVVSSNSQQVTISAWIYTCLSTSDDMTCFQATYNVQQHCSFHFYSGVTWATNYISLNGGVFLHVAQSDTHELTTIPPRRDITPSLSYNYSRKSLTRTHWDQRGGRITETFPHDRKCMRQSELQG